MENAEKQTVDIATVEGHVFGVSLRSHPAVLNERIGWLVGGLFTRLTRFHRRHREEVFLSC